MYVHSSSYSAFLFCLSKPSPVLKTGVTLLEPIEPRRDFEAIPRKSLVIVYHTVVNI